MNDADISEEDTAQLTLLRDSAEAFARRHGGAARVRKRRDSGIEFDPDVMAALADAGFLGMAIPEVYGGLGLSLDYWTVVAEAFGKALLPEPFLAGALLSGTLIAKSGNEALKRQLLPAISQGRLVAAVAWEERSGFEALEKCTTRAIAGSGGATITGSKRFIRPGSGFDGVIVSALTESGLALYWVAADAPGLTIEPQRLTDGGHVADLQFEAVPITDGALLHAPAAGARSLTAALDLVTVATAAELLGIIRHTLTMTLDYLRVRNQFGKPIGSFQALQHRAVNLHIQQELAAVALADALQVFRREAEQRARSRAASRAKARCADAALLVTRESIQMHGAIGFTDEHDAGLYLKRAVVQCSWLGNAAQHRRRYSTL
jgi:alkylation response protein AidB-like acyl-CoA dehydrogenase